MDLLFLLNSVLMISLPLIPFHSYLIVSEIDKIASAKEVTKRTGSLLQKARDSLRTERTQTELFQGRLYLMTLKGHPTQSILWFYKFECMKGIIHLGSA